MASVLVDLNGFDGLGLIVKTPSPVRFTNQVAGLGCQHPVQEGVFVPLPVQVGQRELYALQHHFRGSWHALTDADANVVDRVFRRHDWLSFMRVDRALLADSREAWVHVRISPELALYLFDAPDWRAGVLTWANSD